MVNEESTIGKIMMNKENHSHRGNGFGGSFTLTHPKETNPKLSLSFVQWDM